LAPVREETREEPPEKQRREQPENLPLKSKGGDRVLKQLKYICR